MYTKILIATLAATLTLPALADKRDKQRVSFPPIYKEECGTCHVAFPAYTLSGRDWRQVMGQLGKHYGTDASLDAKTSGEILTWLERNADARMRTPDDGKLPRLTETGWFKRKHREVPNRFWTDPRVKSPASCQACHGKAEQGSYSEREIVLKELREMED